VGCKAPADNAQLVAKEELLNLTVAAAQLEHEQTDEEAQAAVDARRDPRRLVWKPTTRSSRG